MRMTFRANKVVTVTAAGRVNAENLRTPGVRASRSVAKRKSFMKKIDMIIKKQNIELYVDEEITETEMVYAILAMKNVLEQRFGKLEEKEES